MTIFPYLCPINPNIMENEMVKTIWRSSLTLALYYIMVGVIMLIVIFVIAYCLVLKYSKQHHCTRQKLRVI